jgi:predicted glycosyltransferase
LASTESIRAAFGLKIPVVCFMDLPESHAVSRLTLPLASRVCAPWIIPRREFLQHGVAAGNLFFYRALDPVLWLKEHRVEPAYLDTLGLNPRKPLIVCRETEWQSGYATADIVGAAARVIQRRHPGWQIVSIPRYRRHRFYDVPSLLAQADLLIGGGGTMCIEAAYYGTPVIATRPTPSRYMQWLFDRRLAEKCTTVRDAARRAEEIIAASNADGGRMGRVRARRVFRGMSFPLHEIVEIVLRTATGA